MNTEKTEELKKGSNSKLKITIISAVFIVFIVFIALFYFLLNPFGKGQTTVGLSQEELEIYKSSIEEYGTVSANIKTLDSATTNRNYNQVGWFVQNEELTAYLTFSDIASNNSTQRINFHLIVDGDEKEVAIPYPDDIESVAPLSFYLIQEELYLTCFETYYQEYLEDAPDNSKLWISKLNQDTGLMEIIFEQSEDELKSQIKEESGHNVKNLTFSSPTYGYDHFFMVVDCIYEDENIDNFTALYQISLDGRIQEFLHDDWDIYSSNKKSLLNPVDYPGILCIVPYEDSLYLSNDFYLCEFDLEKKWIQIGQDERYKESTSSPDIRKSSLCISNGKMYYVTDGDLYTMNRDGKNRKLIGTLWTNNTTTGMPFTLLNGKLYYAPNKKNEVVLMDLETSENTVIYEIPNDEEWSIKFIYTGLDGLYVETLSEGSQDSIDRIIRIDYSGENAETIFESTE